MKKPDDRSRKTSAGDGSREDLVADLLLEYVNRINAGEKLDPQEVRARHPEVAEDLLREIRTFQGIDPDPQGRRPLGSLGDYRLIRRLGRGGMGVVYEAWQGSLDRRVALKVMAGGLLSDSKSVARFLREAKVAGKLQHPNIVSVYGLGIEDGAPDDAMEYVEGETLEKILARLRPEESPPSPEDTSRILADLCERFSSTGAAAETTTPATPAQAASKNGSATADSREPGAGGLDTDEVNLRYCLRLAETFAGVAEGLQHAHARGVVHRDLKPSNLILDLEGRVRILDFGLARLEGEVSLTSSGEFLGTPLYMSPEQAMAHRVPLDHRADLFSLGATLYEVLTWRSPFRGRDYKDTLSQIISRDPPSPRRLNPRIPRDLDTVVMKCLRKDPQGRYGTAEALAQDLRRVVRGDPIEARPQPLLEKLARRAWLEKGKVIVTFLCLLLLAAGGVLYQKHRLETIRESEAKVRAAAMQLHLGQGLLRDLSAAEVGKILPLSAYSLVISKASADLAEAAEVVPRPAVPLFYRARALLALRRDEEALSEIDRALKLEAAFVPARGLRALLLEKLGRDGDARLEVSRAEEIGKDNWGRLWLNAFLARKERRWKDAAEAYGKLIDGERSGREFFIGSSIENLLERGIARLEDRDYRRAGDDFNAAETLWPDCREATLLKAKAYHLDGRKDLAEEELEALFQRMGRSGELTMWIWNVYQPLSEDEKALAWVERPVENANSEIQGIRLMQKGATLSNLGRWKESEEAREKSVQLLPDSADAWMNLGQIYHHHEKLALAVECLRRALRLDPASYSTHVFLGMALIDQERIDEGETECRAGLKLNPNGSSGRNCLGRALLARKDYPAAAAVLEEAVRIRPSNALAWAQLSAARLEMLQYAGALEAVENALELEPRNPYWHNTKGNCLDRQGKWEEALRAYRMGIGSYAGYKWNRWNEGNCLENLGRFEEALVAHAGAIALDPGFEEAHQSIWSLFLLKRDPLWRSAAFTEVHETLAKVQGPGRKDPLFLATLALAESQEPGAKGLDRALKDSLEALECAEKAPDRICWFPLAALEEALGRLGEGKPAGEKGLALLSAIPPLFAIDRALELDPEAGPRFLARPAVPSGGPAARSRLLYLEARVLQRGGKHAEAAVKLREARALAPERPEPARRLAESLRASGEAAAAQSEIENALGGQFAGDEELWRLWLAIQWMDERRGPKEVLAALPSKLAASGYGADVRWLLERFAAGEPVLIDCGGPGWTAPDGRVWGPDRFFRGGNSAIPYHGEVARSEDDPIYHSERWFPRSIRDVPGYRIPLPPGSYRVVLHLAEIWFHDPGKRRFSVKLEGQPVLEEYEPLRAGFATADPKTYENVQVGDGVLDIGLIHQLDNPIVGAIEIKRVE